MSHRKGPRPEREGKQWSDAELAKLTKLANGNTPTPLIADALGRTPAAVYSKAYQEGISLKPTNKPPYSRRKG